MRFLAILIAVCAACFAEGEAIASEGSVIAKGAVASKGSVTAEEYDAIYEQTLKPREVAEAYLERNESVAAIGWLLAAKQRGDLKADALLKEAKAKAGGEYALKTDAAIVADSLDVAEDFLLHKDDPMAAIGWFLVAKTQGNPRANYFLGHAYFKVGAMKAAVSEWTIAFYRGYPDAAREIGDFYRRQNDFDKAIEWYKKGAAQDQYGSISALFDEYRERDRVLAAAWAFGIIGKYYYDDEEIVLMLKATLDLSKEELLQAYDLHQTLPLPTHYSGGKERILKFFEKEIPPYPTLKPESENE